MSTVRTPKSPDYDATTWAATGQALLALEQAAVGGQGLDGSAESQSTRSIDEAAEAFGELFKGQLPAARDGAR